MIQVKLLSTDELRALIRVGEAEPEIIERGVDIFLPLVRNEVPRRTGRGRAAVLGVIDRRGGHLIGRVHLGKAFYLRILAVGAKAHEITPFRYRNRRSRLARSASRSFGPGRVRGSVRALRLRLGGDFLFRARVRHPGFAPDDFLERAAQRGEGDYVRAAEEILTRRLAGRISA
jgi:hypothetical protein